MAKLNQKLLDRYHDGELRPGQARRVEQQLAESPELQTSLEKTARLGGLLRLMNEEMLEDISFAGFEERVRMGVSREKKTGFSEQLKVRASEFFTYRKPIWVPAVALACAAAALLVLPLLTAKQAVTPQTRFVLYEDKGGSEIESVTFNDSDGAKYKVKNGQGGTVGVVWIVDTTQEEKDSAP